MYLAISITTKARKIGGQLSETEHIQTQHLFVRQPSSTYSHICSVANQEALRYPICMSLVVN